MVRVLVWLLRTLWRISAWLLRWGGLVAMHGLKALLRALRRPADTHGSARFASIPEIKQANGKDGLIVGRAGRRILRFNQPGYALVIAKTRAGKGAGIVIPNLLTYPGSCIVNDIKGENAAITARARQAYGSVHHMNLEQPFISVRCNPLDLVRYQSVHQVDDALEIAKLLHVPDPRSESHWDDKSAAGVAALILHVLERHQSAPALRTLAQVRSLAAQSESEFLALMEDMSARSFIPYVRDTAMDFLSMDGSNEMKSIRSTMEKALRLWSDGSPVAYVTSRSDFDLMTFTHTPQTLFLSVPEEKLGTYGRFLRVMQGCALLATTRAAKMQEPPKHPTLFMLDEAAALGHLEPVETAAGYIAAYAKMVLVFQDLDQLEKTYPKARSIIANAGCLVAFGINDFQTAELLSRNLGHQTVTTSSSGHSQAWDEVVATRHNAGQGSTGRALLDASEILRLPSHQCLVFMRDVVRHPILATKIRYWQERMFKGQFDAWRDADAQPPGGPTLALSADGQTPVAALPAPAAPSHTSALTSHAA